MNWGFRITLLYTSFVAFMLFMVFAAARQDFQLVTEDYYAEELSFDEQITATHLATSLADPLKVEPDWTSKLLKVQWPSDQAAIEGTITFYKPDNADEDQLVAANPAGGDQEISLAGFRHGRWSVKVDWQANGVRYFHEESLFIP